MPLNEKVIGKKYTSDPKEVTQHESIYYALAYNEDNDAYFDNRREGGLIAPPMYAAAYGAGPVPALLGDSETGLDYTMVVDYSRELHWLKPVKPGDIITSVATITHIEVRENGGILGWEVESKNQNDEVVVLAKWEHFDRSAGQPGAGRGPRDESKPGPILWTQEMKVRNGQTYIYAEPSGDHNIIHIDPKTATAVGLPGIILQGICTMAFAHKCAVDNLCGPERDPLKLKKLRVQFSRPVLPGQTLTFQGYEMASTEDGTKYGIIARNEDGKDVLKGAWCLIA
jgi:acyl dehydratase